MKKGKFKLNKNNEKKKKKKGFTLVELLAVISILAVILVVTVPTVITNMNKAKEKAEEIFIASIERSINKFIENELQYKEYMFSDSEEEFFVSSEVNNLGLYEIKKTIDEFITLSNLIDMKYLYEDSLINPKDNSTCSKDEKIYLYHDSYEKKYYYKVDLSDCANKILNTLPEPEKPELTADSSTGSSKGLIPIIYKDDHWEVTTTDDPNWYDYGQQRWANAASLKSTVPKTPGTELDIKNDAYAMFVWIPRFSYTIGCTDVDGDNVEECLGRKVGDALDLAKGTDDANGVLGAIDIKFVGKDKKHLGSGKYSYIKDGTINPTNWYTHPAFTFDGKELAGIWVGKFETSTAVGTNCYNKTTYNCSVKKTEIRILPNVISQRYQKISNQFKYAQYLTTNVTYGLSGDAHISKISDWGAVAYLSHSIYGKYGNPHYKGANKEVYKNSGHETGMGSHSNTSPINYLCKYDDTYEIGDDKCNLLGTGASTTGNIYGIYDMKGGAYEYVMGNFQGRMKDSGFSWNNIIKYVNRFDNINTDTMGFGMSELSDWRKNGSGLISADIPWVYFDDVFSYGGSSGAASSSIGFRVTLTNS